MTRRIKLKDLIDHGLLKPNEKVYMDFRGLHFTARISKEGKFITQDGEFNSMPQPTFLNLMREKRYKEWYFRKVLFMEPTDDYSWSEQQFDRKSEKKGTHIINGWLLWKTWNGKTLDELREKTKLKILEVI